MIGNAKTKTINILTALLLLTAISLYPVTIAMAAKSGSITGQIVDSETGNPIIGASVYIKDTRMGAASDLDGNFIVKLVPPGTYILAVSSIGYAGITIEQVVVEEDTPTALNCTLDPKNIMGKKIVVTATALKNTEANLLRQRQKSPTISDAISSEAISKSGSGDAAEAMTRVTGASVVGGKYVFVRGLGGRYSNARLNGTAIPNADPDNQAVQMDLFPTGLLDNVTVEKTFTPDKPGNFSGGSVDLQTRDMPEALSLSFSSSLKYNSITTGESDFLSSSRGSLDWLGYDNGYRSLPGELLDSKATQNRPRTGTLEEGQASDEIMKAFSSDMAPTRRRAPLGQSYAFSFGNSYLLGEQPLGILASLTYSHSYSYYNDGTVSRYVLFDQNAPFLDVEYSMPDEKGKEEVLWGGLFHSSYVFHPHHKISTQFVYNRQGENEVRYIVGEDNGSTNGMYQTRSIIYAEQYVQSLQVDGDHYFKPFRLDWKASFSKSNRNEPDVRYFSNAFVLHPILDEISGDTLGYDTSYYMSSTGGTYHPVHFFREIDEKNNEFQLNLSVPLMKRYGRELKLSTGTSILATDRINSERRFEIDFNEPVYYDGNPDNFVDADVMGIDWDHSRMLIDAEIDSVLQYIIDSLEVFPGFWFYDTVGVDTIQWDTLTADTSYRFAYYKWIDESSLTKGNNNYTGEQDIFALYWMVEAPITSRMNFVGGTRMENTDMTIKSAVIAEDEGLIDATDWLPSASLTYLLKPDMNLRLAYGRTLARPTMKEKSRSISYEFMQGLVFNGNPDLKRTLINNYDIRWEWFPNPGELLAISGYYKRFKDPIERALWGNNNDIIYLNVDRAQVIGAEFELRKGLGCLWSKLDDFKFEGNLTLTHSKITIPETEMANRLYFDSLASNTRPLQGQSPYIINVGLSYENFKSKTAASLLFNVFGRRLSEVSRGGMPDIYEKPRPMLDFTFSKGIISGLQFKLAAKNLLDEKVSKVIDYKGTEYIFREYSSGRSISVGLSYKI
nr:TonB-dependent receptor [candidate division Zixibacteria bacterium]